MNALLHAATAVILLIGLTTLTGEFWPALLATALFAAHPLRTESVAWVVERKDVLSGFFFALTMWAWASHAKNRVIVSNSGAMSGLQRLTTGYYLALIFFALGLLAKPMLVTLPAVLLLLDWWPLRRAAFEPFRLRDWLPLLAEKLPFIALSAIVSGITLHVQPNVVHAADTHSLAWRAGNAIESIVLYIQHSLWPVDLCLSYGPTVTAVNPTRILISLLVCLAFTAIGIWARKRSPWLLFGWLWYLVMLAPVVDIVQAAPNNARADRYTYLPQIGLCLVVAWAVKTLANSPSRRPLAVCLSLGTVLILASAAFHQTTFWRNSASVWSRSAACSPDNAFVQNQLGRTLAGNGEWAEAASHFQSAIKIDPRMFEATVNLGLVRMNQGAYPEAANILRQATAINPQSPDAFYLLGAALNHAGIPDQARQSFNQALSLAQAQGNTDLVAEIQAAVK